MKNAPDQSSIKSALALAADANHTPTPACECRDLTEIAQKLSLMAAVIQRQTAMIEVCSFQISASIIYSQNNTLFQREAADLAGYLAEEGKEFKLRNNHG